MSGSSGGAAQARDRVLKDGWVERVLGFRVGARGFSGAVEKLGSLVRPDRGPSTVRTRALAAEATRLPEDDASLPDHLAGLAPRYFSAILNEPLVSAKALQVGEAIPAQDQILDISANLDALGHMLQQWAATLDGAERARDVLSRNRAEPSADDDYAAAVAAYDAQRTSGSDIRSDVEALVKEIRAACTGLVATGDEALP